MIIKSIHINSFGGLQNFSLDLSDGANVIAGANESGKSSLAMFVKFVFYGLSSRAGRSGISERARYLNRRTGEASGHLIVLTDDGTLYRIERALFPGDGGNLRERIRVTNQQTGEITSGENPGELFFGVPEEVFVSTCFVSQSTVRPAFSFGQNTAGTKGAVENMLTSADENVDIRKAQKQLDLLRRELAHKNGGGGEIPELKEKRAALLAERNSAAAKNAEILSLSASLDDIKRRIGELEADKERCDDLTTALDAITLKRRIDAADEDSAQLKRINTALSQIDISPLGEGLDALIGDAEREIRAYDEQKAAFRERFPDGETDFPNEPRPYPFHEPKEEEDETENDPANEEVEPLDLPEDSPIPSSAFSRAEDDADYDPADAFEDTAALAMADSLAAAETDEDTPDPLEVVAEVRHLAYVSKAERIAGIALSACAVLGLIVSLSLYQRANSAYLLILIATLLIMTTAVVAVIRYVATSSRLNQILAEWDAESAQEIEIAVQEQLNVIARERAESGERKRMSDALEASRLRYDAACARISELAQRANLPPSDDIYETLRELRSRNEELSGDRKQLTERRNLLEGRLEVLREQLEDVDVSAVELEAHRAMQTEIGKQAAALTPNDIKELAKQRDFTENALRSAEKRRATLEEKLAEVGKLNRTPDELTSMIDDLDQRIETLTLRHDALELASEAIRNAGEELRRDVIPRVGEEASERVKQASGTYDRLVLDGKLNCSLADANDLSPEEILSRGTADLAYLSLRLALAGELIHEETAPVILDESFAHIDEDRTKRFLATLTDRQYLVFTCRKAEADAAKALGQRVIAI